MRPMKIYRSGHTVIAPLSSSSSPMSKLASKMKKKLPANSEAKKLISFGLKSLALRAENQLLLCFERQSVTFLSLVFDSFL